jgi:hypothetical protein
MKKPALLILIFVCLVSCNNEADKNLKAGIDQTPDRSDMTNNFYDNTETYSFDVNNLIIEGEIANPGPVDFSDLPLHSVIVKETLLDSTGGDRFVGAYRYDGYSLFDILNRRVLQKNNRADFNPIIDLYIEVESKSGEKVVFSWGEIYYPNNLHKILISSGVSRIVPSKTNDLWPLPESSKIVVGSDLVTERNISDPVKITVKSINKTFAVAQGLSPMYSPDIKIFDNDKQVTVIVPQAEEENVTYNTIFYGRGRGIHSTSPFTGLLLKEVIGEYYAYTRDNLRTGMFCIAARDGYRCAFSYSEVFNRNDQQEFLLIRTAPDEDGGLFRLFAASDFFSDRAIKSLSEIHLGN